MAYLGNTPSETFHQATSQVFNGDGSTTAFTLEKRVNRAEEIEVFVNNIQQQPTVAYSANNTTLTFTEAPDSATGNIYVVYRMFAQQNTFNALHDFTDAVTMASTLALTGNADFNGNLDVDGTTNLDAVDIDGTLNVQGETTLQTHLNMGDNDKIKLGNSADLLIYHDANDSYIEENGSGNLILSTNGTHIQLQASNGEPMVKGIKDGATELYHNNVKKIETTSSGVTVTGNTTISGEIAVDGNTLNVQASSNRVGIGTGSPNAGKLHIENTASGTQERAIYAVQNQQSGTSANDVVQIAAGYSAFTGTVLRLHHEAPNADQLMLKIDTTGANTVKFSVDEDGDVYVAGGINLGGTGSANQLDDYEEGSFTPTITGTTSGTATGATGAGSGGSYTKIGNTVFYRGYLANPVISGTLSGDLRISLPFTNANVDRFDNGSGGFIFSSREISSGSTNTTITLKSNRGDSFARLMRHFTNNSRTEGANLSQATASINTSTLIHFQGTLKV